MAVIGSTPRRPGRPRGRPRNHQSAGRDSEPPLKRRKFLPGGPGGGGRFLDDDKEVTKQLDDPGHAFTDEEGITVKLRSVEHDEDTTTAVNPRPRDDLPVSPHTVRSRARSGPRRDRDRARGRGRPTTAARPRYSSAAAAAAASQVTDGYKPREEKSWEEFHPDLDIEAELMVFTADEVDGRAKTASRPSLLSIDTTMAEIQDPDIVGSAVAASQANAETMNLSSQTGQIQPEAPVITPKRRPGRPPRRPESMLSGLGSPPAPRIVPLPTQNPKERLTLPKPSFRPVETFETYEKDKKVRMEDYVDKSMAHVGYQESERFDLPGDTLIRHFEGPYDDDSGGGVALESEDTPDSQAPPQVGYVEYDMDEQDERWLDDHNTHRKGEQVDPIKPAIFEITMTQIEREYHALEKRIPKPNPRHPATTRPRSSSAAAVNGESGPGDEPDSKCAICDDGDCENANAIIFCDGCDLAVHQECYGVPFIPEGQWFCRKCKEIGRGTPTCIFCPNIDGAFKQTNTMRWSHLLCAIWIPEVSIANPTFMEPIQDVEKVPRNRWSLNCYICNQRMGACIQCGNKACYQAFHVTCARRARLFLKMKSSHASGIDASALKAFCDRHVPSDWRREHDVDNAIVNAKRYYRRTMKDRKWADSQTAALTMGPSQPTTIVEASDELGPPDDNSTIVVAGNKRKKKEALKTGWRMPSGAPVVPMVVFNAVESSLQRFMIRKRRDFVAEACKYWTLKREARRGAALLKRLQLQLESFSSMEITRRDFVGMGAAGRSRLLRRIEFAELLQRDVVCLREIVNAVSEREQKKLGDAEGLKQLIDIVYFPLTDLLWPILHKALKLAEKSEVIKIGLEPMVQRLSDRLYTSVAAFSTDIGTAFAAMIANTSTEAINGEKRDVAEIHNQLNGAPLSFAEKQSMSVEQKDLKRVAKRIIKAVKEPLEEALRKEAELKGIPFEKEMSEWANLDARLDHAVSVSSARASVKNSDLGNNAILEDVSATAGASPNSRASLANSSSVDLDMKDVIMCEKPGQKVQQPLSPPISAASLPIDRHSSLSVTSSTAQNTASGVDDPWSRGGVPWYMDPFDPVGTTIHDERWTRAMSEALSEMDEETLQELNQTEPPPSGKRTGRGKSMTNGNVKSTNGDDIAQSAFKETRTRHGKSSPIVNGSGARATRARAKSNAAEVNATDAADGEMEAAAEQKLVKDKRNAKRRAQRRSGAW